MNRETLPIENVMTQILAHLAADGAVVVKAEPGAGKTTRIPPAVLDAGLAELANKRAGKIIVLQPRRVAARTAASRISEERGVELGKEVGFQVRFEKCCSPDTRILVCTEGIFLRQLQEDPLLEDVSVVVLDEFHERSVDSDLAIALLSQVRNQVRPDLRIIVMSATLQAQPIVRYLGDCSAVECPGRTHPVEIEYLRKPPTAPIEELAADGVGQLLQRTVGDLLVFLPGVGEIRKTESLLEQLAAREDLALVPLYGDLPLEDQRRALMPSKKRKVVLSTNVAETSLTIYGVTAVVDSGLARINSFDPHLGLNRLKVTRISRASAEQRAGRAGRTAPGICLRLWSEREQQLMRDLEAPEIERVDLSQCVLQLFSWGERDVHRFHWFNEPPLANLNRAVRLLQRLDALEGDKLTELGRAMAKLPLQPRLARLLIEGRRYSYAERSSLCAALLSERNPFHRTADRFQAQHNSDSDILDRLSAIEEFARSGERSSVVGTIQRGAAKQILKTADQLFNITQGLKCPTTTNLQSGTQYVDSSTIDSDEAILRVLITSFPDRLCRRRDSNSRRALMVGGKGVCLSDESAVLDTDLFIAVELFDSGAPELLVRQASRAEKQWLPVSHIITTVDVDYDIAREKVMAIKRSRFWDLVIEELPVALPADVDPGVILANAVETQFDVNTLVDEQAIRYLARLRCLREWLPELELPDFGSFSWQRLLPEWCAGLSSIQALRNTSPITALQKQLTPQQLAAIEHDAPDRITLPGGRSIRLEYEPGKPPILAARIQDLFGMRQTPRIARQRIPVLLHLLAPNYRIQQITADLAGFWKNTYTLVRKELKGRYPKHAWPENPLTHPPKAERSNKR